VKADLARLTRRVENLVRGGGNANRLVVETDAGFLVLRGARGADAVQMEAQGGRHLPADRRLDAEQVRLLTDAGLRQASAAQCFRGSFPLSDAEAPERVARVALHLLSAVYRSLPDEPLRLEHEAADRPTLDDAHLVEAMTHLSRARDARARNKVYLALCRAHLVLPLADGAADDDPIPREIERLVDQPVAAVFTDWDTLDAFAPRGLPTVVLQGFDIFPLLDAHRVASVQINPRGRVGGELYRNEIQTITDGIKRIRGVH
jgi:hypothetical protein